MALPSWQLQTPVSAITFDCDGTLSKIEGIDELAKNNGVYAQIHAMTSAAMEKTGLHPDLYDTRLNLVFPTQAQVNALANCYYENRVADITGVINILQRLNKSIYLISAGLTPAVRKFGELLQIPRENIYAVDISFDASGKYRDFDRHSPLISNAGKRKIVSALKENHEHIVHIGDGMNDVVTSDLVTRLIGYGGVFYRESIAAKCHYYIACESIAPLLPLVLTPKEAATLTPAEQTLYALGVAAIEAGQVQI